MLLNERRHGIRPRVRRQLSQSRSSHQRLPQGPSLRQRCHHVSYRIPHQLPWSGCRV
jgi:hypothetical protein